MNEIIRAKEAPEAIGPYSQAVKTGNMIFVTGLIGINPETGKLVSNDVGEQARQTLKSICAILKEAGATPANVVKATIFLADMADFAEVNKIYAEVFTRDCPARSCVEVSRLPLNAKVAIESIAVI